jgi:hypothetical protein
VGAVRIDDAERRAAFFLVEQHDVAALRESGRDLSASILFGHLQDEALEELAQALAVHHSKSSGYERPSRSTLPARVE